MSVTKIVITGGPCAGKSTAMSTIQSELTKLGYKVYFITESATEVITSGVTPDLNNFQKHLLQYQLDKEKMYENIAKDTIGAYKNTYTRVKYIFDVNFFIIVIHRLPCLIRH